LTHRPTPARPSNAKQKASVEGETRQAPPARQAPPDHDICEFSPHDLHFDVDVAASLRLNAADALGAQGNALSDTNVRTHLRATLHAKPLAGAAGPGTVLAMVMRDVRDDMPGGGTADLTTPFLVRIQSDCRIDAFARPHGTDTILARRQQALAYELSFSEPSLGSPRTVDGEDGTGRIRSTFAWAQEGGAAVVARTSFDYTGLWQPQSSAATGARVVASAMRVRVSAEWFEALTREATVAMASGEAATKTEVHRVEAPAVDPFLALDIDPAHFVWEDLLPKVEVRTAQNAPPREFVAAAANMSSGEAMAKFADLFNSQSHIAAATSFLWAYLEAKPSFAVTLADTLRHQQLSGMQAAGAYVALQQARTPEAGQALASVRSDTSAVPFDRTRATMAIASRSDTGLSFVNDLRADALGRSSSSAAAMLASEAPLALGVMADIRAKDAPDVAKAARSALLDALASASSEQQKVSAIAGIGNTGDATLLGRVAPFLADGSVRVRKTAADVVRKMPASTAAPWLLAFLGQESDPDVRESIYHSAWQLELTQDGTPTNSFVPHALADLPKAESFTLRQELIRFLGVQSKTNAAAKQALIAQFHAEPEAQLRELIGQYATAGELTQGM
jgi:hypothetical protein